MKLIVFYWLSKKINSQKDIPSTRAHIIQGMSITKLCTVDTGKEGECWALVHILLAALSLIAAQPSIRPQLSLAAALLQILSFQYRLLSFIQTAQLMDIYCVYERNIRKFYFSHQAPPVFPVKLQA